MAQTTIYTDKDTQANASSPDQTYGSDALIQCLRDSYNIEKKRYYIGFDVSSINGTVTDAQLYVYHKAGSGGAGHSRYFERITDNSWSESGLCWNNKPSYTETNRVSAYWYGETDRWEHVNITNMFNDQTGNDFSVQMHCISGTGCSHAISSREGGFAAYIVVTYTLSHIYVKLTGNDSDDGSTWALAKLTINAGINALATDGTLHIGFGDYHSQATITLDKTMFLKCETAGTGGGTGTVTLPPTT